MGNYSITNLFQKEPVAIAGAVRSVLWVLVLLSVVTLDEKALAGIALALEVVLGLFARSQSTSVTQPSLNVGTRVSNPAAPDGDNPPPDLIVAKVEDVMPAVGGG